MKSNNFLGIWMDHSIAHFMEYNDDVVSQTILSEFTHQIKIDALTIGEKNMHSKEHQQQEQYYKKIGAEILKYNKVLLFGPTDAKLELHNYLLKDHHFDEIKFDIKAADKMTTKEQCAFVKKHFMQALK